MSAPLTFRPFHLSITTEQPSDNPPPLCLRPTPPPPRHIPLVNRRKKNRHQRRHTIANILIAHHDTAPPPLGTIDAELIERQLTTGILPVPAPILSPDRPPLSQPAEDDIREFLQLPTTANEIIYHTEKQWDEEAAAKATTKPSPAPLAAYIPLFSPLRALLPYAQLKGIAGQRTFWTLSKPSAN